MVKILTESNGGADTGEDEEQGGDELGDVRLDRGEAARVADASDSDSRHFFSFFFSFSK